MPPVKRVIGMKITRSLENIWRKRKRRIVKILTRKLDRVSLRRKNFSKNFGKLKLKEGPMHPSQSMLQEKYFNSQRKGSQYIFLMKRISINQKTMIGKIVRQVIWCTIVLSEMTLWNPFQ